MTTKTPPAIDLIHWMGIELTPAQSLSLEAFKKKESSSIKLWSVQYPALKSILPIYFSTEKAGWVWRNIRPEHIVEYISLCNSLVQSRSKNV